MIIPGNPKCVLTMAQAPLPNSPLPSSDNRKAWSQRGTQINLDRTVRPQNVPKRNALHPHTPHEGPLVPTLPSAPAKAAHASEVQECEAKLQSCSGTTAPFLSDLISMQQWICLKCGEPAKWLVVSSFPSQPTQKVVLKKNTHLFLESWLWFNLPP